jgi:5-methyltetrahydrofolate--homocysteine methyltransferase
LQGIYFGGEAIPFFDTHIGPGSLAMFIGSNPKFAEETVWYEPFITDPDHTPPLRFDPHNPWYLAQKALLEEGMNISQGRFLVGMPDLIENLDTLASLRDSQLLMLDMIERPDFVKQRIEEINQVYFEVFSRYFELIQDPWGGNIFSAFAVWGPGKTAKVQCDAAALISPRMFAEFVAPALTEQCAWLDYAIYHLDGTQALPILDTLLAIEPLQAIEWTPQVSLPQGGDPMWYDLYRRILNAGKSVQAISVKPHEVIPLLNAVGTKGLCVMVTAENETQARALVEAVAPYYPTL